MARRINLSAHRRGKSANEERWRRRARTREAGIAAADHPDEVAVLAPASTNGSGNGRPTLPGGGAPGGPGGQSGGKPRLKKLRMAIVAIGLTILAGVAWIFGIMMAVAQDVPALESRAQYDAAQNSVVIDSEGERVATLTNNEGRILVESGEIAPTMKEAVVAIEDRRF